MISRPEDLQLLLRCYEALKNTRLQKVILNYDWKAVRRDGEPGEKSPSVGPDGEERATAAFISFCPPSVCEFDNFSVNFLRLLYAECYMNPNFVSAKISYNPNKMVNNGVGGALKEVFYQKKSNSVFSRIYKLIYDLVSILIDRQQLFRFDLSVIQLNEELRG